MENSGVSRRSGGKGKKEDGSHVREGGKKESCCISNKREDLRWKPEEWHVLAIIADPDTEKRCDLESRASRKDGYLLTT